MMQNRFHNNIEDSGRNDIPLGDTTANLEGFAIVATLLCYHLLLCPIGPQEVEHPQANAIAF